MKNKELFIKCTCGCGGLYCTYDLEFGDLEMAYYIQKPYVKMPWMKRLRLAWRALCNKYYEDMVIIDDQEIDNLVDYLTNIQYDRARKNSH